MLHFLPMLNLLCISSSSRKAVRDGMRSSPAIHANIALQQLMLAERERAKKTLTSAHFPLSGFDATIKSWINRLAGSKVAFRQVSQYWNLKRSDSNVQTEN
jgi:hypothetical protein